MLDMKLLKDDPDFVREACRLKGVKADVERAIAADARRREILLEKEALQNERNRVSKDIAAKMRSDAARFGHEAKDAMDKVAHDAKDAATKMRFDAAKMRHDAMDVVDKVTHDAKDIPTRIRRVAAKAEEQVEAAV